VIEQGLVRFGRIDTLVNKDPCQDRSHAMREGACCEPLTLHDDNSNLSGVHKGQSVEIEWLSRGRTPMWFAAGWRHPGFNDDGWR
jgi:hypothetical protein